MLDLIAVVEANLVDSGNRKVVGSEKAELGDDQSSTHDSSIAYSHPPTTVEEMIRDVMNNRNQDRTDLVGDGKECG